MVLVCLFGSCTSQPHEDLRREGQKITRLLIKDLQKIHNRDDLLLVAPLLEKHFLSLSHVMLASRKTQEDSSFEFTEQDRVLSEQLRVQLNRVYQIEGGREVIEKAQETAIKMLM